MKNWVWSGGSASSYMRLDTAASTDETVAKGEKSFWHKMSEQQFVTGKFTSKCGQVNIS